jgi:hypothetical protein
LDQKHHDDSFARSFTCGQRGDWNTVAANDQRDDFQTARRSETTAVSWYGRLLIFSMLLVAAGWEIFRLILTAITLD